MSDEIHIIGILCPREGKMDRLIELISTISNRIHENEKDITRFSLSREVDKGTKKATNTLVLIETYASQVVLDRHFAAPEYERFQATLGEEGIIDFKDPAEAEIRVVRHVAGFM